MRTEKQLANLRRGGQHPPPEATAKARVGKALHATRDERLADLSAEDPWSAYEELHKVMTKHIARLLRSEEASGAKPAREVTDRLREYRATTDSLSTYRLARHGTAELDERFFRDLEAHVREAAPRLEQALGLREIHPPEPEEGEEEGEEVREPTFGRPGPSLFASIKRPSGDGGGGRTPR